MASKIDPVVIDATGAQGRIRELAIEGTHPVQASIELADGSVVEIPTELLHRRPGGGYTIPGAWDAFAIRGDRGASVPVIEERVTISTRERELDRVRVRRRVVSEQRLVETPITRERIEVERVPIDRIVTSHPAARQDGDTLVIPCVHEEVVVETRLRLVEEIRIRVVREQAIDRRSVSVRRHEVTVTHEPDPSSSKNPNDKEEP